MQTIEQTTEEKRNSAVALYQDETIGAEVFITQANLSHMVRQLEPPVSFMQSADSLYPKPIHILTDRDRKYLQAIQWVFENSDRFMEWCYQKADEQAMRSGGVFDARPPAYHLNANCNRLLADYENISIPPQIEARGNQEVELFKQWANKNRILFETQRELFKIKVCTQFNINPNELQLIGYENSGYARVGNENLDEIRRLIDALLSEAEHYSRANPKHTAILGQYQRYSGLGYSSQRLYANRTGFPCDEERPNASGEKSIRIEEVDRALVVGHPSVSVCAFQSLMKEGIPVSFVSEKGYWYGTLHSDHDRNASRRLTQYRHHENIPARLHASKQLIQAKLHNQRRVLQRLAANRKESNQPAQQQVLKQLIKLQEQVDSVATFDELRGIEGLSAARYFSRLAHFFPQSMPFNRRSRRPPKDAANALLSWTYTIVYTEIDVALRAHGLDPCMGWLHEISSGRSSLALDLIEPLRAPLCDLFALRLLNHEILQSHHFEQHPDDGGTYLSEEGRRIFFTHYDTRMSRKFKMPGTSDRTDLRQCIEKQVWNTIRLLEKKQPADLPPFFLMP